VVDFVIPKASHSVASITQEPFSLPIATALIVRRMGRAVPPDRSPGVDDKFFLATNEVGEVGANRLLANELESAEKAVSKSPPKLAFSPSLILAQPARSARFIQA
jgi:hypothetical protein